MPSSDQILSLLLSALLHLLGLLLIGSQVARVDQPDEKAPELEVTSVELTLTGVESESPAASSEGAVAPQPDEPLPPLEMPRAEQQPPPPAMPEKPAFADALTPPPAPVSEPTPSPAPPPPPVAVQKPSPDPPSQTASEKRAAPPPGDAAEKAVIQPANGGAYGRVDAHPSLHRPIKPHYPIGSRRRGEEGTVILDVTVDADGNAKSVSRVATSGFPELDRAAERAAAQARFKPGTRNGRAVESAARITIIFRLRDS